MLNETIWNIFEKTGSIEAYLYTKAYDESKNRISEENKNQVLEIKEITII